MSTCVCATPTVTSQYYSLHSHTLIICHPIAVPSSQPHPFTTGNDTRSDTESDTGNDDTGSDNGSDTESDTGSHAFFIE